MKREIENTIIVGMGALGLLFGQRIAQRRGAEHLCCLMDPERARRHAADRYTVNGEAFAFRIITPEDISGSADLIIIATKYSGLAAAREQIAGAVGPETTIVSLLNGISSEEILAEKYPRGQILDCIAIGMDAVREGTSLTYRNIGRWQIGSSVPGQEERLAALARFLDDSGIPYEICADIQRAMWNKFMLNVGINQTCMVYETGYGGATAEGTDACDDMRAAMHEVIRLAQAEDIRLTEQDCENNIALLRTLAPELCPSMRQDALSRRPSEVELFAGTVIRLAERHNLPVPVNERYYRVIREMERAYAPQ